MGTAPEADGRSCPTAAELAAFLSDELTPDAMDDIGAHVSGCPGCDAAVRRMTEATDGGPGARRAGFPGSGEPDGGRIAAAVRAHPPALVRAPAERGSTPHQLGQYRIGEQLGRGGMGAVYRAEHARLKKSFAVKILSPEQTRDRRAAARFQLEMEVVGRLDHPNLVRATDAGEVDGVHFLVMELIEGVNLAHLLLRCGPLPVPEACELIRQAAVGLQHAHEHGLVHRDVKPSNLMLSRSGEVKLLDLGLALLRAHDATGPELTVAGEVMGTAEYMAPEQWAETRSVDIRADVYSLGCTLYALLSGNPPFVGSGRRSFRRLMSAHQHDDAQSIADYRPDAPRPLCALLARMLAKSPDDRPATPGEVAAGLERLAAGANLAALLPSASDANAPGDRPRPRTPGPTPRPAPARSRLRRGLVVAALVLVGASAGAGIYSVVAGARPAGSGAPPAGDPPGDPPNPKKWRNLLTERHDERLKRLWAPRVESVLDHRRAEEVLVVQSRPPALIRLGDAPTGAYRLHIGLKQIEWTGRVGVYFGGRVNPAANEFVFQFLHVSRINAGKGREYGLCRSRGPRGAPGDRHGRARVELHPAPGRRGADARTGGEAERPGGRAVERRRVPGAGGRGDPRDGGEAVPGHALRRGVRDLLQRGGRDGLDRPVHVDRVKRRRRWKSSVRRAG
ncbi:MAG: serine/threonine protein kinase [Planctomycetes bacterium]|nr:serine/threonine protein kinase [Planctomycetota bacterium]